MPKKWILYELGGYRPEAREGGSLTRISVARNDSSFEDRLYLFGGLGRGLLSALSYFYITANGINLILKIGLLINVPVEEGNEQRKRYGHTASAWEGMLVVVGGSKRFNKTAKIRECLVDVQVYDPNISQWTELQCAGLEPRRHHVACVVGRYLVVHGGVSTFGNYLNSMAGLLLGKDPGKDWKQKTYKWFDIKAMGNKPKKVAYHSMQLVLQYERYGGLLPMDLFSLPEMRGISYRVFVY